MVFHNRATALLVFADPFAIEQWGLGGKDRIMRSHKVMSCSCSRDSWQVKMAAVGDRSLRSGSEKNEVIGRNYL